MVIISPVLSSILPLQSVALVPASGTLGLIGIYYGFLTVLPFGFSQIVCLRACLLEAPDKRPAHWPTMKLFGKNVPDALLWGFCGLMVAQLALFVSAYYPPLYALWVSPHALSMSLVLYALFYAFRIRRFERLFRPDTRMWQQYLRGVFIDSAVFQWLNPVLLPSPVLARVMSLGMFRYSQKPLFLLGGLVGWLLGHATLALVYHFVSLRLQSSLRRLQIPLQLVHEPFSLFVLALCLALLNHAAYLRIGLPVQIKRLIYRMPTDTTDRLYEARLAKWKGQTTQETWPENVFLPMNWKRPIRSLRDGLPTSEVMMNAPIFPDRMRRSVLEFPFLRKHFSEHFFEAVISDGNRRLSHTYPHGLRVLRDFFETLINLPRLANPDEFDLSETVYRHHWHQLNESVADRVKALDQGTEMTQVLAKRLSSWTETAQSVQKWKDPRLAQSVCGRSIFGAWRHDNLIGDLVIGGSRWNLIENDNRAFMKMTQMAESTPDLPKGVLTDWISTPNVSTFDSHKGWMLRAPSELKALPLSRVRGLTEVDIKIRKIPKVILNKGSFAFRRDLFVMRSRLRKAVLWNLLERQLQAPFWLRIGKPEKADNSFKTKSSARAVLQSRELLRKQTQLRYNNLFVHILRSPSLLLQWFLRRYVRQPLFILLKGLARWFLFQPSEWDQDWFEWKQETVFYCEYTNDFRGVAGRRPRNWWFYGLQVRIVSPFRIRPWHHSTRDGTKEEQAVLSSFLDVIGQEHVLPFGTIRRLPSFWRPVRSVISLRFQTFFSSHSGHPIVSWYQSVFTKPTQTVGVDTKPTLSHEIAAKKPISLHDLPSASTYRETYSKSAQPLVERLENENIDKIVQEQLIETKLVEVRQTLREFDSWASQLQSSTDHKTRSRASWKPSALQKSDLISKKPVWEQRQRVQTSFQPYHLRTQLLSDESYRSIQYRTNQLQEVLLQIRRQQMVIKRELIKQGNICSSWIKQQKQRLSWSGGFQHMRLPVHSAERQALHLDSSLNHLWRTLFKSESEAFASQEDSKRALSQAYLLHKVWEANTSVQPLWSKRRTSEVLNFSDLQAVDVTAWQEWLDPLYHHRPPLRVWQSLAPQQWTSKGPLSSSHQITDSTERFQPLQVPPLLEPLFLEAKNASLRCQSVALSRGYTDPLTRKAVWSKQDGLILTNPISRLGGTSSGRSTLAMLSKGQYGSKLTIPVANLPKSRLLPPERVNDVFNDFYMPIDVSFNFPLKHLNFLGAKNTEARQELSDLKMRKELKRKQRIHKPKIYRNITMEHLLLHDARLLQNLAGMWLGWLQTQPSQAIDPMANPNMLSSMAKGVQKPVWQMIPFTPEETLLPFQIRTLRVLNSLMGATPEASRQSGTEPSHSAALHKEPSQPMNESHAMMRFLWSSYRLEDLACMNRAWIGTANQSRFSALRLRMYPPIPTA